MGERGASRAAGVKGGGDSDVRDDSCGDSTVGESAGGGEGGAEGGLILVRAAQHAQLDQAEALQVEALVRVLQAEVAEDRVGAGGRVGVGVGVGHAEGVLERGLDGRGQRRVPQILEPLQHRVPLEEV